ncbi:hypothetical protein BT69DRAFT_1278104 [Atractiella rhizophila]|nr:hypothetical protein BT69DRAFT_1278104 [Atractiella rhizophila]
MDVIPPLNGPLHPNPAPPLPSASFLFDNVARKVSSGRSFAVAIHLCHFPVQPAGTNRRYMEKEHDSPFSNALLGVGTSKIREWRRRRKGWEEVWEWR